MLKLKHAGNQQGYALLVVLLLIVLFTSIAATFIAGSMNNAKQEQTVDVSNQSIAAAEMGVVYSSSDFETDIEQVKREISAETQLRLNELIACIRTGSDIRCDSEAEREAWEEKIDGDMRFLFLSKVSDQISALREVVNHEKQPFPEQPISYQVVGMESAQFEPTDEEISEIKVEMEIEGQSAEKTNVLSSTFTIKVPETFLNEDEALKVQTDVVSQNHDIQYSDIFTLETPAKSCTSLLAEVKAGNAVRPYDCKLDGSKNLMAFIDEIVGSGLDPEDFRAYTSNFLADVCPGNCNNLDFRGISLVVQQEDIEASRNMNNIVNGDLIFNGKLSVGNNLINLGKNGIKQNIIVKELEVDVNIKNMYYTNFLVLGNETGNNASLKWGRNNHFQIDNYSRLCIDIDRINSDDLNRLAEDIEFSNSGSLIYYSSLGNVFSLTGKNAERRTELYVTKMTDYTTFLENCGVTIKDVQTITAEVAVPNVLNTGFEFDVDY